MPLHNLTIPTRTIKVGENGVIEVRGISLSDLMTIVDVYGPQASMTFAKVQQLNGITEKDVRALIGTVSHEFPDMVAAAMALAADDYSEESIATLRKVPFHKQIEVVEAIFSLTFTQEGEIKKLLESLTSMIAEVSGALTEVQHPSLSGIGASGAA